jgi:hypothetical protein
MSTAHLAVTVVTILANAAVAIAELAPAERVVANAATVRVPSSWLPCLAALKVAAAASLVLGLAGVPVTGTAAAAGLVLYFIARSRPTSARASTTPSPFRRHTSLALSTLVLALAHIERTSGQEGEA